MLQIKERLRRLGKSVMWLKKETGMPYANVYDLVNGRRLPRSGEMEKINTVLEREEQKHDESR